MFRTELFLAPSPHQISHHTPVFSIGSCFAQAIGDRLNRNKFPALVNPFGVIFNPMSVFRLLEQIIDERMPEDHTYLERQGVYFNYHLHSDFSSRDKMALHEKIRLTTLQSRKFLKEARYMLLTMGTAWVYERKEEGDIVANCHKMPADTFRKRLLKPDEITHAFEKLSEKLKAFNPDLKLILTVSPVRHIKDTLPLNNVSKSTLRLVTHELENRMEQAEYFPSFELMLDDLRDYRFFDRDMLHPTELAEDYIWEKFGQRYFSDQTRQLIRQWTKIRAALEHRPFHPATEAHQQFIRKTIQRLEQMAGHFDVSNEIDQLKQQLL